MTTPGTTCTIGYLAEYLIRAEDKSHVKAAVDFARENNVHFAIRNTGHCFMGRSIAAGSLTLNTHSFKSMEIIKSYTGPGGYTGGAVKVGSGVQGRELYRFLNQQSPPLVVVGGECPTVGFSGGYIQGGGHGPLTTKLGMAADHALEFEVVTTSGEYVTANAKENPDLFWALKGGGGATFGIVTSVTVKTFPEQKTAGAFLDINSTHGNSLETFWKAADAFHGLANHYVDNGMFVYYELMVQRLHIQPFTAPDLNAEELNKVLEPLFEKLDNLGVNYTTGTKEFDTFYDMYIDMYEDEKAGDNTIIGGRFFAREDIENNQAALTEAFKTATDPPNWELPGVLIGHIVAPGLGNANPDNSIHPKWRDASSFSIVALNVPFDASLAVKEQAWDILTNTIDAALIDASPNGGAYVNEGNLEHPDWQDAYWGSNYQRLHKIRKQWDPQGILYGKALVGTEEWDLVDEPPRLCKVSSS
jgi:FAD/FMN-containing dehydrogenase